MGGILDRLEYLRSTNYSFGEGELKKLAIDIKIFGLKQVLYRLSTNKAKDKKRVNIKPELAFLYSYLKRENLIRIKDNAFDFRNEFDYIRAYEECFLLCEEADLFYDELHSEHKEKLTALLYKDAGFAAETDERQDYFKGKEYGTDNEMGLLADCLKQKAGRIKGYYIENGYIPYVLDLEGTVADKSVVKEKMKISYKYADLYEALYLSASSAKGLFRCYCDTNKVKESLTQEEIDLWFGTEEQEGRLVFMDSHVRIYDSGEFVYHRQLKNRKTSMNVCIFVPEDMDNADKVKKLFRDCWKSFAFRDEKDNGVTEIYQQYEVGREAV